MKKCYSAPTFEILEFKSEDIITTSVATMAGFNGNFTFTDDVSAINSISY